MSDNLSMEISRSSGNLNVFCILDGCGLVLPWQKTTFSQKTSVTNVVSQMLPTILEKHLSRSTSGNDIDTALDDIFSEVEQTLYDLSIEDLWVRVLKIMEYDYGIK